MQQPMDPSATGRSAGPPQARPGQPPEASGVRAVPVRAGGLGAAALTPRGGSIAVLGDRGAPLLIGIDAGTSVMKAVAFSLAGDEVATAAVPNKVLYGPGGFAEQDMGFTRDSLGVVLRSLATKLPDLAERAACLAITGQGDGTWLVDRNLEPVGPAILWLDGRSGELVRSLRASGVGAAVSAITGTGLNTSIQSGHLCWLRDHQPERLMQAAASMHCKDWLYLCCTDDVATDFGEGLFTFGDPLAKAYAPEVLRLLGLSEHERLLPPMRDGSTRHRPLTARAAQLTGLPEGLPVVLAPMDVPATALGAGLYAPGREVGVSILGSTGMHARLYRSLSDVPPSSQQGYLFSFPVPDLWQGSMSHMAATLNLDWLCDRVAEAARLAGAEPPPRAELLKKLEAAASRSAPGGAVYHPFISEAGERGPFTEPLARAQFSGLSTSTDLGALARAVFEGIAFATRDCYEAMGVQPEEIRLTGGAARSMLMRQILANVMNCPVRISRRGEAGAAGAALVGAVSIGLAGELIELLPEWVDACLDKATIPPNEQAPTYRALFDAYRSGYQQQFPHWQALHNARHHHHD